MAELADIFRDHQEEYFRQNNAPTEVMRAVFDVIKCCTPEMGRSILCSCPDCGHKEIRYQSCGNRNCPKCGHHKVVEWIEKRMTELLPVDYFMITFTLPHEFNTVFKRNPAKAVKILFKAASEALLEIGLSHLQGTIGFMMVYQSWCRNGNFHPHIHALVPCGALSKDKQTWNFPKDRYFIFHETPLMELFRGKFNAAIRELPEAGGIKKSVFFKDYVVHIKWVADGVPAFKYLAAYTQRGFLGNDRIIAYDGQNVTFRYQEGESRRMRKRTLPAVEFMQLYLQHVLPKGVQRIRYGGIWAAPARKRLAAAKEILSVMPEYAEVIAILAKPSFVASSPYQCPKCHAIMNCQLCPLEKKDSS
jgi:hypothetical protein